VAKSRSRPLIVEWPSTDRASLESAAQRGLVVVRYLGCEMELLPRCHAQGQYAYTPVTQQSDRISIRNLDDLYANVPLGAAKLEGELSERGELNVDMVIVGTYDAPQAHQVQRSQLEGDCRGATHMVSAMTAGAFAFYSGAGTTAGGGVGAFGLGGGAKHEASRSMLSQSGNARACQTASREDTAPPEGCGALLRVEVVELASASPVAVAPRASSQPVTDSPLRDPVTSAEPEPTAQLEPAPTTTDSGADPLPPYKPRRVRLDPGLMLGIRGPFFVNFGNLQEGVSLIDIMPIGAGANLEVGYRTRPELAVVLLAGINGGTSTGVSSTDLCPSGVECKLGQVTANLGLHANDPYLKGVWADLSAAYVFSRFGRSGEPTDRATGEFDTSLGYHAAGPSLQIGYDWTDSYAEQIRYGFMIGYTLTKVFAVGGRNDIGGNAVELDADLGITHSIMFGGRLHGEFNAVEE